MLKVLIIDDEPFTVEMLQTFLQIHSYTAIGAFNGADGIVLSQVEAPDVLILDLMLPDLDGFEICRRLRGFPSTAHLPVLILSARTAQVDKDKALAAGANGYLTKPVRFPDLLSELKRLLTPPSPVETSASPASINGLLPPAHSPKAT
ncbi:MAG: response regulator transcription factor [Aggregatilineales bacterium]